MPSAIAQVMHRNTECWPGDQPRLSTQANHTTYG